MNASVGATVDFALRDFYIARFYVAGFTTYGRLYDIWQALRYVVSLLRRKVKPAIFT